jgi:hypothetical protein
MAASQNIFEWTKKAKVRRNEIMEDDQHLKVQLTEAFSCVGGSV